MSNEQIVTRRMLDASRRYLSVEKAEMWLLRGAVFGACLRDVMRVAARRANRRAWIERAKGSGPARRF